RKTKAAEKRRTPKRPSMSLSLDDVRWVAHLARLELTSDELDLMARQLGEFLDYVRQLQELDTTNVEPLAHPLEVSNVFPEDEPPPSLPPAAALANAPDRQSDFFGVPAVLD